jgi:oligopeptide/dipeptide ABC transporter ATP-binding protein
MQAKTTPPLLEVKHLTTEIRSRDTALCVVNDISLEVRAGEIVGLVGESGSGKSMAAFSLMQLFPTSAAYIKQGQVLFEGKDLLTLPTSQVRKLCGQSLSMIFQDPSSYLDPLQPIKSQIGEALAIHKSKVAPAKRITELLRQLGLPDDPTFLRRYPHQLSGGQRQRVLLAGAIACQPKLLIADEPTTALDVTVQAQILELLDRLRLDLDMAVLLITHDMGVVAELCDRVYVMYAGRIVETNSTLELFRAPQHPYTYGLLHSTLGFEELFSIPGTVPNLAALPQGCAFRPRCPLASKRCLEVPPITLTENGGTVACWHNREMSTKGKSVWEDYKSNNSAAKEMVD